MIRLVPRNTGLEKLYLHSPDDVVVVYSIRYPIQRPTSLDFWSPFNTLQETGPILCEYEHNVGRGYLLVDSKDCKWTRWHLLERTPGARDSTGGAPRDVAGIWGTCTPALCRFAWMEPDDADGVTESCSVSWL